MKKETGIKDKKGVIICDGDYVSLEGNITADDSSGNFPNGWVFDEEDVYKVYWDERINNWSLDLGIEPNSDYNCKYMSHAINLLHKGKVEIKNKICGKSADLLIIDDPIK